MTTFRAIIIVTLATFGCFTLSATDGSAAYNFLDITSSPHIYGLGGVNISTVEDNIGTTDQNPALLGGEMDLQLNLNYMRYIGNSNFAGVKFGKAVHDHGTLAIGIKYFGYGEMDYTNENGDKLGTFSAKDMAFSLTYSHDITDRLRGGISVKYLYSAYDEYSAMALTTDLGLNYYNPNNDLSLSLVVANLGGQIKRFNESYDRLPIDVRLGFTKGLGSTPIRLSVTAWNLTKWRLPYYEVGDGTTDQEPELKDSFTSNLFRHLVFGLDFVPSERFHIGIGYNYKTRTDMSTYARNILSGFSIGAGINIKSFGIEAALSQPHTGATTFMIGITCNINNFIK